MKTTAAALMASLLALPAPQTPSTAPPAIPLCESLTVVTAIDDPKGDYESIKRVAAVTPTTVDLVVAGDRPFNGNIKRINVRRSVRREDLRTGTFYFHHFDAGAPMTVPGSTAIGTSSAVLNALKASGSAEISVVDPAMRAARPEDMRRSLWPYKLQRTGARSLTVLVNGTPVALPAIEAQGSYFGDRAEFAFLDDERNPLTLRYRFAAGPSGADSARLQVVQISYRCDPAKNTPEGVAPGALEQALLERGRADVYEIYFEFGSDRLREVSEPTLKEIGDILRKHPDWKLAIEGHTDSIASDAFNLDLSQRRAAAVKDALSTRHGANAARLTTAGFGESRPKDRNDTLEGRARNRRVELVRQ